MAVSRYGVTCSTDVSKLILSVSRCADVKSFALKVSTMRIAITSVTTNTTKASKAKSVPVDTVHWGTGLPPPPLWPIHGSLHKRRTSNEWLRLFDWLSYSIVDHERTLPGDLVQRIIIVITWSLLLIYTETWRTCHVHRTTAASGTIIITTTTNATQGTPARAEKKLDRRQKKGCVIVRKKVLQNKVRVVVLLYRACVGK